jgi:hypothetical protein
MYSLSGTMTKGQDCDTHGTCVFFTATAVRCVLEQLLCTGLLEITTF